MPSCERRMLVGILNLRFFLDSCMQYIVYSLQSRSQAETKEEIAMREESTDGKNKPPRRYWLGTYKPLAPQPKARSREFRGNTRACCFLVRVVPIGDENRLPDWVSTGDSQSRKPRLHPTPIRHTGAHKQWPPWTSGQYPQCNEDKPSDQFSAIDPTRGRIQGVFEQRSVGSKSLTGTRCRSIWQAL
jgi:hypothetical protein